ncbi:hypothetical protein H9P43_006078 [Blastocladiella emersonii ATCC 22665]|nr:hypothetical protein H9P43_006078 [Blastocladiella emersonii ATCC 22665]
MSRQRQEIEGSYRDVSTLATALWGGPRRARPSESLAANSLLSFQLRALAGQLPTRARLHQFWPHRYESPNCAECLKTGVEVADTQTHAFACPALRALVPAALDNAAPRISSAFAAVAEAEIGGGLRASVAGSLAERLLNPNRIERTAAAIVDAPLFAWF